MDLQLSRAGQNLIPTRPGKDRTLLKQGKARVVQRIQFIVQLLYSAGENKQDITLGIDAGVV